MLSVSNATSDRKVKATKKKVIACSSKTKKPCIRSRKCFWLYQKGCKKTPRMIEEEAKKAADALRQEAKAARAKQRKDSAVKRSRMLALRAKQALGTNSSVQPPKKQRTSQKAPIVQQVLPWQFQQPLQARSLQPAPPGQVSLAPQRPLQQTQSLQPAPQRPLQQTQSPQPRQPLQTNRTPQTNVSMNVQQQQNTPRNVNVNVQQQRKTPQNGMNLQQQQTKTPQNVYRNVQNTNSRVQPAPPMLYTQTQRSVNSMNAPQKQALQQGQPAPQLQQVQPRKQQV